MSSLEKPSPSMSSRKKKKKTRTKSSISSLPDELMMSCIARLSRLYHPTLSLVSKRFPSLLASSELYKSRSLLNRSESCLYVLLQTRDSDPRWFTLCRKPDRRNETSKHILVPIATSQSPPEVYEPKFVAAGSEIYTIGGSTIDDDDDDDDDRFTSRVSVLDCRSHTWREAPKMRFERQIDNACVVNGHIYVIRKGESRDLDCLESIEVFDIKTEVWNLVHYPPWKINMKHFIYFDGKLHLLSSTRGMSYDMTNGKWDLVERENHWGWIWDKLPYCVIDNVMYRYDYEEEKEDFEKIWYNNRYGDGYDDEDENEEDKFKNMFVWYDSKVKCWKILKGLVRFPEFPRYRDYSGVKLVDYGGKMAVLWAVDSHFGNKTKIWCAVIVLERRDDEDDEVWGKVEWIHSVFTSSSSSCDLLEALTVTL